MPRALAIAFACFLLVRAPRPLLAAPLDPTDASPMVEAEDDRAGMCNAFDGLTFTFCVALCEARDCDLLDADDARCALLRDGFARSSGGASPPCLDQSTSAQAL